MRMVTAGAKIAVAAVVGAAVVTGSPAQALSAVTPGGIALVSWSMPSAPADGVPSLTFPITITKAPHSSGYYYAQQFNFVGVKDVGYTGLQPREDNAQGTVLHAAFSSFVPGTKTSDDQCTDGADGGPGVSCAVDFPGTIGHRYELTVSSSGTRTWTGTARDTITGKRIHVGEWTLPDGAKGIAEKQVGFVEYYGSVADCSAMPKTSVVFGHPFTASTTGKTKAEYEYGNCKGKAAYSASTENDGAHVSVGFGK